MEERQYNTAYTIAKISEYLGWIVIFGGIVAGVIVGSEMTNGAVLGIGTALLSILSGLALVFSSQLTLIFIDTEHNTRQIVREMEQTNAMLADTLGKMVTSLNKIATKED